ncbi:MAG: YraN family protein [Thermomicrobia bacterium]|nr:YraN family protein [Thermomicrobia bacterium]
MTKPPSRNAAVGASGERIAALLLEQAGCRIIARNWHCRGGELDLVALDGDTLVCVEVRVRTDMLYGSAAESVVGVKTKRVLHAVAAFIDAHPEHGDRLVRIDVVAITLDRAGRVLETLHMRDAIGEA